jgi:4-hydroxy-3-methylbut-2-enyl diphosphate reductase
VDLGFKSDGIISKAEFIEDSSAVLTEITKPGDVVEVFVIRVNDGDGNVLVSKKRVDNQLNYRTLEQAFNEKTALPGKITDLVKGGLIASILGCRAFVPAGQISGRYEQNLEPFKGKEFNFHIIEFDRSKRRIVASRKELAIQETNQRREEIFGSLEVGQSIEGTVSRIVDFGAFVDLGGVDGLIHVSEVSWKRVRKPSDVLAIGDKVKATVINIDSEKGKISLSLKDVASNPWNGIIEKYPIGEVVEGTVVRLAQFGAFVSLEDGVDGLVHISQIADKHVTKPDDELSVGQTIQVRIMNVDLENHKISLSKREADAILNPAPIEDTAEEPQTEATENE